MAYQSFPSGGCEVGGILFGKHAGDELSIEAAQFHPCSYESGPVFILSAEDERALAAALSKGSVSEDLEELTPVGLFLSHNRSSISLRAQELAVFNRHFPEAWQFILILRPFQSGEVRGGFFTRNGNGELASQPEENLRILAAEDTWPSRLLEASEDSPETPRSSWLELPRSRFIAAACGLAAAAGLLLGWYWAVTPSRAPLKLRIVQKDEQLVASWDASTKLLQVAEEGWLRVVDGKEHLEFPLDQNALRAGSYPILALTDDVRVQLRVYLPRDKYKAVPVEESTRFIGADAELSADSDSPAQDPQIPRLQRQLQALQEALKKQVQINQYLEARLQRTKGQPRDAAGLQVLTSAPAAQAPLTPESPAGSAEQARQPAPRP